MVIKSSQQDGITIYQVNGEINISTSPELKKIFEKDPPKKIVVDLEKVSYIDSSGLATLVEMLKKTKSRGGSLGLASMSDKVKSLFEITKLDKLFSIHASQQDAIARIQ